MLNVVAPTEKLQLNKISIQEGSVKVVIKEGKFFEDFHKPGHKFIKEANMPLTSSVSVPTLAPWAV